MKSDLNAQPFDMAVELLNDTEANSRYASAMFMVEERLPEVNSSRPVHFSFEERSFEEYEKGVTYSVECEVFDVSDLPDSTVTVVINREGDIWVLAALNGGKKSHYLRLIEQ